MLHVRVFRHGRNAWSPVWSRSIAANYLGWDRSRRTASGSVLTSVPQLRTCENVRHLSAVEGFQQSTTDSEDFVPKNQAPADVTPGASLVASLPDQASGLVGVLDPAMENAERGNEVGQEAELPSEGVHGTRETGRRVASQEVRELGCAGTGPVRWHVTDEEAKSRLDRFIKKRAPGLPPGLIQRIIRQRKVIVSGTTAKQNAHIVQSGDLVEFPGEIKLGLSRGKKKPKADDVSLRESAYIQSRVIHRDARCVVLDKPSGLATQGGTDQGSRHVEALLPGIGSGRYWLVHRLDKEVSGALVIARDVGAAAMLAQHFRSRHVEKIYWAFVHGDVKNKAGTISLDVDGKPSETEYRVLERLPGYGAWLALRPRTGRKHQLRIHCAEGLGTPIVGDRKYGGTRDSIVNLGATKADLGVLAFSDDESGIHLHARSITFPKLTAVSGRAAKQDVGHVHAVASLPPHMKQTWAQYGWSVRDRDIMWWTKASPRHAVARTQRRDGRANRALSRPRKRDINSG